MKKRYGRLDIVLNGLALAILIGTALYLAVTWRGIPDSVPMHYNTAGEIDRYGSKISLIALAAVPWGFFLLLTAVEFIPPSMMNTGFAVTGEAKARVRAITVHLLGSVKLILAAVFSYFIITSAAGIPIFGWFVPAFLVFIFVFVIFSLWITLRVK